MEFKSGDKVLYIAPFANIYSPGYYYKVVTLDKRSHKGFWYITDDAAEDILFVQDYFIKIENLTDLQKALYGI